MAHQYYVELKKPRLFKINPPKAREAGTRMGARGGRGEVSTGACHGWGLRGGVDELIGMTCSWAAAVGMRSNSSLPGCEETRELVPVFAKLSRPTCQSDVVQTMNKFES